MKVIYVVYFVIALVGVIWQYDRYIEKRTTDEACVKYIAAPYTPPQERAAGEAACKKADIQVRGKQ